MSPSLTRPQPAERLPTGPGWVFEPKYDGYRALVECRGGIGRLVSRRGTDLTRLFPELATAVVEQVPDGSQLDGEIVVLRDGRLSFDALQERMAAGPRRAAALARSSPATLVVFDVLVEQGSDRTGESWTTRRDRLEVLGAGWRPPVQATPCTDDRAEAAGWMAALAPMGIEGVVAKRAGARYGAAGSWVKVKQRQTLQGVVGAVVGPLHRPEALVVGRWSEDGELGVLGRAPLAPRQSAEVGPLLSPPSAPHPWPDQVSAAHFGGDPVTVTHADPVLVVEVRADTAESGGRRRHPLRFVRVRLD
ncbi:ATP-dependent DNA ligase [Desertihabitans brevis]|uniref:ATP-dependent DNA ligase n=1 Tax=Desertihabitans brevis TaxID=2268447 RepID=A0A367YSX9_9ACTN|nr:ATP-dependent DNA ligase [Desertihabitans brevis]RCK68918.1 ATP-dependent DNA ligase [Desertihabitans brevis]